MNYDITSTQDEESKSYKAAANFPVGTIGFLKEGDEGLIYLRAYHTLICLSQPAITFALDGVYHGPLMQAAKPGFTVTLKVKA